MTDNTIPRTEAIARMAKGELPHDHDWQLVKDWYGDPDVVNGTADCSFRRCRVCGEEDRETPVTAKDWADEHDEDKS